MPDLSIESGFDGPVIGVDEAGRGPWAGPVTVAAAWLDPDAAADLPPGLDDSKKMTAANRAAFHAILTQPPHHHVVLSVPVATICLLYTSPSPRDRYGSRMPSSA